MAALREGRLSASPRRWWLDLQQLYGVMTDSQKSGAMSAPPPVGARDGRPSSVKDTIAGLYALELWAFLRSGATLRFEPDAPRVSVLLVLYNRAELTFRCLRALREVDRVVPLDVIIVDNGSSDDTPLLLSRLSGVQIIRSPENLGFLRACNDAARVARGEYLLFLNNDAELMPGAVEALLQTLESSTDVGAVVGRLILPDGRLQEAGSIIWRDGSCLGYGRDASPWAPEFAYQRDVDYGSAALMLTPRQLFLDLGLFDERLRPAYYEDTDYCVRVWKAGRRVVYEPRAIAIHFEFASSKSAAAAVAMQVERRGIFVQTHRQWLDQQPVPDLDRVLHARERPYRHRRILIVDDQVPHTTTGFGFPRANDLIWTLTELGHFVTLYPTAGGAVQTWEQVYEDLPRTVEVLNGHEAQALPEFIRQRAGYYDCIMVSRPHNMQLMRAKLGPPADWAPNVRLVYDAEAVAAEREIARRQLIGERVPDEVVERLIREEVELARGVDAVLTVSPLEGAHFERGGIRNVHVVSHRIPLEPTPRSFAERDGLLFVGAFNPISPNGDAVLWFVQDVLPRIRTALGVDVPLKVAGHNPPIELTRLRIPGVDILGGVADLTPLYDAARVFVAPTRFAAGIPFKVGQAAARGIPVVATSLLVRQLGWESGTSILAASTADAFADAVVALYTDPTRWQQIRDGALRQISQEYSAERFRAGIRAALEAPAGPPRP